MSTKEKLSLDELEMKITTLIDVLHDYRDEAAIKAGPDDDETEFCSYSKIYHGFKDDIHILEQRIIDMQTRFNDAQLASQVGLQNVYAKFVDINKRQIEIEELLKSDRIVDLVKKIPTESDIKKLLSNMDQTDIGRLNKNIINIKDELERLTYAFTI